MLSKIELVFQRAKSMTNSWWKDNGQHVISSVSRIFLAIINVWSKLHLENFSLIHPEWWLQVLFFNKFWSHLNYYNIAHDVPDLVLKSVYLFNMNPANPCLIKFSSKKKVWNMFTVNNIYTKTTPLTSF